MFAIGTRRITRNTWIGSKIAAADRVSAIVTRTSLVAKIHVDIREVNDLDWCFATACGRPNVWFGS